MNKYTAYQKCKQSLVCHGLGQTEMSSMVVWTVQRRCVSSSYGCVTVCWSWAEPKQMQNCCKGDMPCQWTTPIFTPLGIENPWTDRHQTRSGWLCQGPHATHKFDVSALNGGQGVYVWNCHYPCLFLPPPLLFYFLAHLHRLHCLTDVVVYGSKDVIPQNLRPFWGANKNFWHFYCAACNADAV